MPLTFRAFVNIIKRRVKKSQKKSKPNVNRCRSVQNQHVRGSTTRVLQRFVLLTNIFVWYETQHSSGVNRCDLSLSLSLSLTLSHQNVKFSPF